MSCHVQSSYFESNNVKNPDAICAVPLTFIHLASLADKFRRLVVSVIHKRPETKKHPHKIVEKLGHNVCGLYFKNVSQNITKICTLIRAKGLRTDSGKSNFQIVVLKLKEALTLNMNLPVQVPVL